MGKYTPPRLRTALKRSMGLGSAHSGTRSYRAQLLSGLFNIPLFIFFILSMVYLLHQDYDGIKHTLAHPVVALLFMLMLISGIYHMYLGMRVILEDYISYYKLRALALVLNTGACFLLGVCSLLALLKIALGG